MRILPRRWQGSIPNTESAKLGELFFDPLKRRFGLFPNVDATTIDWLFSFFDSKMALPEGKVLTGRTAIDTENGIVLDWSNPGILEIRNTITNTVIATFQNSGVGMLSPSASADVTEGLSNYAINGNLGLIDALSPTTMSTEIGAQRSYAFQPNWHVWRSINTSGELSVTTIRPGEDVVPVPPNPNVQRYFVITTSEAPASAGLTMRFEYRMFVDRYITYGADYWAPAGEIGYIRLRNSSGTIATTQVVGTGSWVTKVITQLIPEYGLSVGDLYVDYLYAPSGTVVAPKVWRLSGAFFNIGRSRKPYEALPAMILGNMLNGRWKSGVMYLTGTSYGTIDFAAGNFPIVKTLVSLGGLPNVVANGNGIAINVPNNILTDLTEVRYTVHKLITNAQTA